MVKNSSYCLYLDEVIDLKFIAPSNDHALVCTNSESLKLLNISTNEMELYSGHNDIILCIDICPKRSFAVTGAKDNAIRLWHYDLEADF
jgi:U3 small nucleolar RNA-associated protein 13